MTKPPLGRLEPVPLREYWEREDTEFTPWLSTESNLSLLSEVIGMDLEPLEREARVGPYRADILCRDQMSDALVLVENQLESTDHSHLGQLMTYAAGLDAVNIVWIASTFNDQHRAALDWLNEVTREGFHFFGLEVQLWRIGSSAPAPRFNLVAKPNEWTKSIRVQRDASLSEQGEFYLDFWTELLRVMSQRHPGVPRPNPARGNQLRFDMPQVRLACGYGPKSKRFNAYFLLRHADEPMAVYQRLRGDRSFVEELPENPVEWWEGDGTSPGTHFSFAIEHEQQAARLRGLERASDLIAALDRAMRKRFGGEDVADETGPGQRLES